MAAKRQFSATAKTCAGYIVPAAYGAYYRKDNIDVISIRSERGNIMRVVLQRVKEASVFVDKQPAGSIGQGYLILLGVGEGDTRQTVDKMIDKICRLRIFQDGNGKTNLSLADVGGEILVVSQFTLYADCRKGNRPSFTKAGPPEMAKALYDYAVERCRMYADKVEQGVFGAYMEVSLVNDGPFTLMLDSRDFGRNTF